MPEKYYRLVMRLQPEVHSLLLAECKLRNQSISAVIRQLIIESAERREPQDLNIVIEKALLERGDSHDS